MVSDLVSRLETICRMETVPSTSRTSCLAVPPLRMDDSRRETDCLRFYWNKSVTRIRSVFFKHLTYFSSLLECFDILLLLLLLFAVTHAPFHVSSAEAYSWPSARDRS